MNMTRPQFSVARLLGIVAFVALAVGLLQQASSPWASLVFTFNIGFLIVAALGALVRRGERRAYWLGGIICGGSYLLLWLPRTSESLIRYRLATTHLLSWGYPRLVPEVRQATLRRPPTARYKLSRVSIGEGLNVDSLAGKVVNVFSRTGQSRALRLLAEQARIVGVSRPMGNLQTVDVQAASEYRGSLTQAQADGSEIVLVRWKSSPLASLFPDVPVQQDDFEHVGHALFGILFAYLGGCLGRYFGKDRQAISVVAVTS